MYICPCCKKEVQPNAAFCGNCGVPFAVNGNNVNAAEEQQQKNESSNSGKGLVALTIILIAVLSIVIVCGVIFGIKYFSSLDSEKESPSSDLPVQSSVVSEENVSDVSDEYMLNGSDSRYISRSELIGMTEEDLRIARNEIFARHGRKFKDASLQSYFDSKSWYYGYISPDSFDEKSLNNYEKANLDVIIDYEKEKGYR